MVLDSIHESLHKVLSIRVHFLLPRFVFVNSKVSKRVSFVAFFMVKYYLWKLLLPAKKVITTIS
jgi:hypothetical protein